MMTTITPNSVCTIIPGNPYVRASSLLWAETNSAIQELQTNSQGDVAMAEAGETNSAIIGGCAIILNALRQLVEHGLIVPLQRFHSQIKQNEQERCITKATVELCLTLTAECITAVVEAEHPVSCPILKGLIQEDVDTLTEELRQRIQSLEGKLAQAKNVQGNGKRTKKVTKGTAITPTKKNMKPAATTTPKLKPKLTSMKKSKIKSTKKPTAKPTPAAKGNDSCSDAKRNAQPSSKGKLHGKGRGKSTAACK
jgi:hypothetical protein